MTIDFFLVHVTLADGGAKSVAGCLDSATRVITFSPKVEADPELASSLQGAWVDTRDGVGLRVQIAERGFVTESQALFDAKQLVQDHGFEVLFDEESGYHFWRARNWVADPDVPEEYWGCLSAEEAYFVCVKQNELRKISVAA
jgi:hypothetical protein